MEIEITTLVPELGDPLECLQRGPIAALSQKGFAICQKTRSRYPGWRRRYIHSWDSCRRVGYWFVTTGAFVAGIVTTGSLNFNPILIQIKK